MIPYELEPWRRFQLGEINFRECVDEIAKRMEENIDSKAGS